MSHWNRILEQASMTRVVATALIVFSVLACLFPRSERQKESDDIVAPAIGKPGDSFGDPRIVSRQPLRVGNEFVVAWITDSSPLIYKIDPVDPVDFTKWEIEGMIQRKILDILPGLDGRRLKFKMYMQYGNRGVDKYFQAQAAISQKPDLLIYGVNPTFDFTTANILGEPMTPGSLATYGDRAAWAWALILSSPADLFQGVLMRLLPAVRDRYDMGEVIAEFRNRMDWFGFGPLRPAPDKGGYSPMWEKGLPEYDKQHVPVSQVWELLAMGQM